MAEIETSHDDAIADLVTFDKEEETVIPAVEKQEMEDNVDDILIPEAAPPPPAAPVDLEPTKEVEESTEILPPTSTPSGVEEVSCPDISSQDTDEAIVDGFPAQTKPQMNGAATTTPSLPTPTTEGFEELTGIDDKPAKKDDTLKSPLALWIMKQNLHPEVVRLIYWVELQRTTGVFGGVLLILLALQYYPLIGVVMTFALSLLVVAFLYRIGMTIVKAVQKTSAEHPFKHLLEEKIEISEEAMEYWSNQTRLFINETIRQTQCLFLVKDTVASLKAMIMFWLVSYVANCIDFLNISILATVFLFTVPKLYEEKQVEIDQLYTLVKEKSVMACGMIEDKLPEKMRSYLKKAKCE
jgi:hypothetical protein